MLIITAGSCICGLLLPNQSRVKTIILSPGQLSIVTLIVVDSAVWTRVQLQALIWVCPNDFSHFKISSDYASWCYHECLWSALGNIKQWGSRYPSLCPLQASSAGASPDTHKDTSFIITIPCPDCSSHHSAISLALSAKSSLSTVLIDVDVGSVSYAHVQVYSRPAETIALSRYNVKR